MPPPNFLILLTDTQGANMIGAYGHAEMQTPNLDRLGQTGTRFERAYTTCPLCTPARAALFTGIFSHTSGAWTNNLPLGTNIQTMGQRFQNAGYHSAYIGKWHLDGHDYFGTGLCPPGWDPVFWYDGANYLADLTDEQIALWRKGLNSLDALRAHDIQPEFTWAHCVSDRAIAFLERREDRPFLLVASYDEPHHPYTCPPEYAQRFQDYACPIGLGAFDSLVDKPAHQREWADATHLPQPDGYTRHPLYFGCNSFVDAEIGRVIDAVHHYTPENTYVIFTSDHGDMLGAHRLAGKGPAMYEEITHIPLIIEQPGGVGGPVTHAALTSHIDLLPTLLELAGQPVPPILEGQSLVPLLNGQEDPGRAVVMEFNRYEIEHDSWGGFQPIRSIIAGVYKLVINLHTSDELYNLELDPAELENRIENPGDAAMRDELHDRLLDWMYTQRDPFRGPAWERRPWRQARRFGWRGKFRPRPADGVAPPVRDYDTGQPTQGEKIEFG
jgi:uncharacterized sulfatase